jgi:hypothetical protein
MDPDNFVVMVSKDNEVPIQFYCGPKEKEGYLSSYYSCNSWIKEVLKSVPRPEGYRLDIGAAESLHCVDKEKGYIDENDPIAINFIDKCVDELVKNGAKLE